METETVSDARIKMPPEIAKAILVVAKQIKQLGKDETNAFAKFQYVSVDKFYAVVGPMMAEAGLFTLVEEASAQTDLRETQIDNGQVKKSVWLTANYEITVFHETGVQYGPIHRMITVPATGPQAFGSGMSYVEKYFLRGLFKIPTGEEDADGEEQTGVPTVKGAVAKPKGIVAGAAPKSSQAPAAKPWAVWLEKMHKNLGIVKTTNALNTLLSNEHDAIESLKDADPADANTLQDAIDAATERCSQILKG
jgi:hypothetical protein